MKRLVLTLFGPLVVCAGGIVGTDPALRGAADARPNVLLIYADDLGYNELSCYGGGHVKTPHIDSLAADGVRFTQGYVSAPLCSPSRAGLMTGRYQTRFGHENNSVANPGLALTEVTLADRLKALGYATCAVGKWHLGRTADRLPTARGFDEYYGVTGNPGTYFEPMLVDSRVSAEPRKVEVPAYYTTDAFAARAADWIGRQKDRPWFLYLPFNAIHGPREAPQKYLERFAHVANVGDRTLFAMTAALDDAVGVVLEKVRALGQEKDTLVFFISDNGAPNHPDGNGALRGHKHTTWEGGIRLPFIARWPGRLPAGKLFENPVIQLDVMPTCVAAAGGAVDPAWTLDGVDLLPYLTGWNTARPHEDLFWRIDGMWAVRHHDWKLVHGSAGEPAPELFDLAADLGEKRDLAAARPSKVKELQALWDAWNSKQAPAVKAKAAAKTGKKAAKKAARKARAAAG